MSTIYVLEAVNLFCGDHDPQASKHLTITELKLPDLQAIYADHHPGGARVAIEVELGVQKLEPTFKLAGFDPDLLSQFGLGSRMKNIYTAYGHIRDKRTGKDIEAKAIIEARLGKIAPDAYSRGELVGLRRARRASRRQLSLRKMTAPHCGRTMSSWNVPSSRGWGAA